MEKEKDSLHQRVGELTEQLKTTELLKSDEAWQTKYNTLREKSTEELVQQEQSWESTVKELQEEVKVLKEELYEKLKEAEEQKKAKGEESTGFWSWLRRKKGDSNPEGGELTEQLRTTEVKPLKSDEACQKKYNAQQEKSTEELVQKEQRWERAIKELQEEVKELKEKQKEADELREKLKKSQKALKKKVKEEKKKKVKVEKKLKGEEKSTGFWSRFRRKKDDPKVEKAVG